MLFWIVGIGAIHGLLLGVLDWQGRERSEED